MAVTRVWRKEKNGSRRGNGWARHSTPSFLLRRHLRRHIPPVRRRLPLIVKALVALLVLALVVLGGAGVAAAATYYQYARDLEGALAVLETRHVFETSRIYDRHGVLLYEFFDEGRRTQIESLDQIPRQLISATIAVEDKTFYTNPGVDPQGIVRAALNYLGAGMEIQGGGSTLTQQFIRNALFTPEERYSQELDRKIKEAILALEMTRTYSKDQILLMYFNEIPYGNLAYGVQAAAQAYFDKDVGELDLAECSFLAGLPQAPTLYNPYTREGLDLAKARQHVVLQRMVEEGYITRREADDAYNEELRFARPEITILAPHFVFYVRQLLEENPLIGRERLYGGGLSIYTTLDMRYQRLAEAVIRDRMLPDPNDPQKNRDVVEYNAHNAALVAMRPDTGEILAMVGSVDYDLVEPSHCGVEGNVVDGNVNAAVAQRQPGSSFKPITYLTAFMKGWSPATMVLDVPTEFPVPGQEPYAPKNYSRKWYGPVRLRQALANSLNMPAVKVIQYAGVGEVIEMAHRLGIRGLNRGLAYYGLSLTLGGGEVTLVDMVTANATLANQGRYVPPQSILKVVDAAGRVLYEYKPQPLEKQPEVADPRYVYEVTNILSDDAAREMSFGRGGTLALSRPAAAKTGTSEDWSDGWTLGYTPYLVAGVWVGNNNNEPMTLHCAPAGSEHAVGLPGVRTAGRIWRNFMETIFHPDRYLPVFFPDEEQRGVYFGDGDLEDVLRSPSGRLQFDFARPPGLEEHEVCAISGKLPGPNCPVVTDIFVEGQVPQESCDVHKTAVVVQIPGTDPPQYCLPLPGAAYPPELLQEKAFVDLFSIARLEELPGVVHWYTSTLTPQLPTEYCPPELVPVQPGEPGGPVLPPLNRWAGLVRSISWPTPYRGITGPIEIRGSADITSTLIQDQFNYYKLEWGARDPSGQMPTQWNLIGDVGRAPVRDGILGVWDPGDLPDGAYVLRLTVVTREGRPLFDGDEPGHTYVTVYLDRGPMSVLLLSPTPGSTLRQSQVPLIAKVNGVAPAARVDFFYDGIFVGTAITDTFLGLSERVYSVTWQVRPGQHVLTVQATNTAGRTATSQRVLVIGEPPQGYLPGEGHGMAPGRPRPVRSVAERPRAGGWSGLPTAPI